MSSLPHQFIDQAANITRQAYPIAVEASNGRFDRGINYTKQQYVTEDASQPNVYYVQAENKPKYAVNTRSLTCTCPDFQIHKRRCKHRIAVYHFILAHKLMFEHNQAPAPEPAEEEAPKEMGDCQQAELERIAKMILALRKEAFGTYATPFIYGLFKFGELDHPVEVVASVSGHAHIRALPRIGSNGELDFSTAFIFPSNDPSTGVKFSTFDTSINKLRSIALIT